MIATDIAAHKWPVVLGAICMACAAAGCRPTRPTDAMPVAAQSEVRSAGVADGHAVFTSPHVPLDRVARISRFRSGVGHDYSDGIERCRSMKHYFQFTGGEPGAPHDPSWTTVPIVSPLDGIVVGIDEEWAGDKVRIRSAVDPRYTVVLFHVRRTAGVDDGTELKAGQAIGFHASDETMSDVAVEVVDPAGPQGRRLVSAFEVMANDAFAAFEKRGVADRAAMVIGRVVRDTDPLRCDGDRFTARDRWSELSDWVRFGASP